MRLTLTLLGFELDVTLGREQDTETACSLDGGTLASTPVGFVRSVLPDWEDPGGYHTIDPGDDSEE